MSATLSAILSATLSATLSAILSATLSATLSTEKHPKTCIAIIIEKAQHRRIIHKNILRSNIILRPCLENDSDQLIVYKGIDR